MAKVNAEVRSKEKGTRNEQALTLAKALAKKQGRTHVENDDAPVVEKKAKVKPAAPAGKKPPTRSAGRGR